MALTPYIQAPFEVDDPDNLLEYFDPKDPCLNAGTKLILDFDRVSCFPSQADPANGAVLTNLKTNPNATVVKTATNIVFDEKGFRFNGTTGNFIQVGAATDYRLSEEGNPDFANGVWYKRESTDTYGSFPILFGRTNSYAYDPANFEFQISLGATGQGLSMHVSNGTVSVGYDFGGAALTAYQAFLNQTCHIGLAVEGGVVKAFLNGVLVGSTAGFTKPYSTYYAQPIRIGQGFSGSTINGVVKRTVMHDLGYGMAAAQIFAKEYELNSVRMTADD